MADSGKKYLIVGPSWVGDMVMAQSLFIHLKQRYPNGQIDVLAPQWTAALIDRMPQVDRLVSSHFQHGKLSLGERWNLGRELKAAAYTHAIVLPNSLKAALVPAFARIPIRIGFVGEQRWGLLNDVRRLNKTELPMTVQRFLALGKEAKQAALQLGEIPKPRLEVNANQVTAVLLKYGLSTDQPILALCPGAEFGASKKWPSEHYAKVAQHYLQTGYQVWLLGSEKDRLDCQKINQLCGDSCQVLAGETSMPEAIDLMSNASLVVSNDSGLMHIAAALQKPLVAVYGSTDPAHTPPLSSNHAIARLDLDCSPCFKRECPLQHLNCLQQLMPQQIIELADRVS